MSETFSERLGRVIFESSPLGKALKGKEIPMTPAQKDHLDDWIEDIQRATRHWHKEESDV